MSSTMHTAMKRPLRLLHVFATFGAGGPQVRTCDLMKALGPDFRHTILAADGHAEAQSRIAGEPCCRIAPTPPGKGSIGFPFALYRVLRELGPDLLVTYNWGAFDAVLAGAASRVCPVV